MSDKKKSNVIYIARCIALVCIVLAHSSIGGNRMLHAFANAGVAIFFIATGVYYKPCALLSRLKRMRGLIVPWVLLGSGTYLLNVILTGTLSIREWFLWLLGYNTYLWYLTIYVVSLLIFSVISIEKYKVIQWLCVIVMILSRLICSATELSGPPAFLNPLNWMGFIALGLLISDKFEALFYAKRTEYLACASVFVVFALAILGQYWGEKTHYFGWTSVFSQLAWSYFILYVSSRIGKNRLMSSIGKNTFPIYLVHICFISWICSTLGVSGIICLVLSVLVVLFLYAVFMVAEMIVKKNKYLHVIWKWATGFSGL